MNPSTSENFKAEILVVDDTPANLHLITRILSNEKYRVRPLSSGEAALTSARLKPPDIILLDILMPGMDGFEVCTRLKAEKITQDIPVIFLSAQGEVEDKVRAFDTGAIDYITKPFQAGEVLARIDTHIKIRDLQRQLEEQNNILQNEILERQQAEMALSRRANEMVVLYQSSLAIASGLELTHVLTALHEQIQEIIPADISYVALYSPDKNELIIPVYYERGEDGNFQFKHRTITYKGEPSGFASHVISTRATLLVPDALTPDLNVPVLPHHLGGLKTRSYLGIPLIWQDQVLGVLSVQCYQPGVYNQEHIRLAEAVAVQASIAIQNANLYDQVQQAQKVSDSAYQQLKKVLLELERMANTDKLTGAYNRHKFDEIISGEMKRSSRYGTPLSLVIFDIDHFKKINDTYGHLTGDQVLFNLSNLVQDKIRESDSLARWGGEEFIVLAPGTGLDKAAELAERLREIVATADFSPVPQVTISLGVSQFINGDTQDTLISRADDALYSAKNNGRNRVGINGLPTT